MTPPFERLGIAKLAGLSRATINKIRHFCVSFMNAIFYYGSLSKLIIKTWWVLRNEGFSGLCQKVKAMSRMHQVGYISSGDVPPPDLYGTIPAASNDFSPKVSVIVPNYNHASYLRERLDSIYQQSYKNMEVILLDDCSSDGSQEILDEYAARHPGITITNFNNVNSGGVFNQWKKGLSLARGDLIWIAESDDYCSLNLLHELVRFFRNEAVMLAFCNTDFVQESTSKKSGDLKKYLADLKLNIWSAPFIRSAHWLVNHAWAIKNIVPNVSSAIFRHPGQLDLLDDAKWRSLRLCGDWIFYLNIIRGGLIGFSPMVTNYYRQHDQGTSFNTQKEDSYYQEHEYVATCIQQLYRIDSRVLKRQRLHLYIHWCVYKGVESENEFNEIYSLDRASKSAGARHPNVMMAAYALIGGGGETFPIMLANQIKRQGVSVTFLNCKAKGTEPGIRYMLDKNIPLLEIDNLGLISLIGNDLGVEVAHSHHAWVDMALTHGLRHTSIKHIITMHGMYEEMQPTQFHGLLPVLEQEIDRVVYTAEKNLAPFTADFIFRKKFIRIDNALARSSISPIERSSLGIGAEDFVLCLVSRAIPEKGWEEAIKAVELARKTCPRTIHLLLIGNGPELDRLKNSVNNSFIHFVGFKPNIRDYFAMSDMGFLPSRFRGESFPLVLIDCLLSGKPFLASHLGEISNMLQTADGLAGEVFDLDNGTVPIERLSSIISDLAIDKDYCSVLTSRVEMAAKKFDVDRVTEEYLQVYESVLDGEQTS